MNTLSGARRPAAPETGRGPGRRACLVFLALATASAAATPSAAQRQGVLPQIRVPHDYYYREMYLPQVSSGPTSVTWSPDGRSLAYSMQGTLWLQELGTNVAVQLTAGPGYDHQPDWSPDGRYIAYASYRNDAIDLRILDVATGETRPLLSNGAVHVEPRWAPAGGRLAFVSTAHEGRWHVYVMDVVDGRPGSMERLTEDRDSGLPRYYYSRFDHYLSPTWSPAGNELILVSNRGRTWGTGGIWRMRAEPGAAMQEIHFEETTWKARPDWSPDGHRVVYSSYLGRQWNQLWLMPSEGGDVFPLTYGDFDATAPRWSRDGGRIAFVTNEGGNTSLEVIEVPGGRKTRVEVVERSYLEPTGRLRIEVVDASDGRPLPARISVTAADGRGFAPHDAWRHADDGFDRSERPFEHTYFHASGSAALDVPAGLTTVEVMHGLEYRVARREIAVADGATAEVRVELERIADPGGGGWLSGDLHVHMNYGGTYRNDPGRLAFQASAEGLDVIENLIVNKEQRIPDIAYFRGRPDGMDPGAPVVSHSQEFHTSLWGHSALLGLRDHILLPDYAAYVNTAAASPYPDNVAVADLGYEQDALFGYVHPFASLPSPEREGARMGHELPVGVALGKVDYIEVVGFSDHRSTAEVWYRLLDTGFRVSAGAGTDAMANFASLRGPVGLGRVYVQTGGERSYDAWLEGIRDGRTFATNAPLLQLEVDGRQPGDEIRLPAGRHELRIAGSVRSIVPIDHLEIVSGGEVVADVPLAGDGTAADFELSLTATESSWYTLRAWNDEDTHPVLDDYPFGTTSPVYVIVGDQPIRSAEDARYFVAWVDRLREAAERHEGWNTEAEKALVLESIARARAEWVARGGGG